MMINEIGLQSKDKTIKIILKGAKTNEIIAFQELLEKTIKNRETKQDNNLDEFIRKTR